MIRINLLDMYGDTVYEAELPFVQMQDVGVFAHNGKHYIFRCFAEGTAVFVEVICQEIKP